MRFVVYAAACLIAFSSISVAPLPALAEEPAKPSAELGRKLFNDPSLGTNGRTCAICHPSEKKIAELADRDSWFGGKARTLEQAVNICINGPLEGKPLPEDSVELKSIAMFMRSLIE